MTLTTFHTTKSAFIANISHDVRTPLSGIIGLAENLMLKTQTPPAEIGRSIMAAGLELLHFLDEGLAMAKAETAEVILRKERFDVSALLDQVMTLLRPAAQHKGLIFSAQYSRPMPPVLSGNRAGIYRILMNLLGNAIKFTSQGSVVLNVRCLKKPGTKKVLLRLVVADTGIGIPQDKQSFIFERCTRLIPSNRGIYAGSGMGLYLVDTLVTAMQGEISLHSEEGKGSRFIVVLPLDIPLLSEAEYSKAMAVTATAREV